MPLISYHRSKTYPQTHPTPNLNLNGQTNGYEHVACVVVQRGDIKKPMLARSPQMIAERKEKMVAPQVQGWRVPSKVLSYCREQNGTIRCDGGALQRRQPLVACEINGEVVVMDVHSRQKNASTF